MANDLKASFSVSAIASGIISTLLGLAIMTGKGWLEDNKSKIAEAEERLRVVETQSAEHAVQMQAFERYLKDTHDRVVELNNKIDHFIERSR